MEVKADSKPEIWVVDHLDYWRTLAVAALRCAGFSIQDYREYAELLAAPYGTEPHLVLLGCVSPHTEEQEFLRELVRRGWPVIVLASSLSLADLRDFVHAGAADVMERPQTSAQLLSLLGADRIPSSREQARLTA